MSISNKHITSTTLAMILLIVGILVSQSAFAQYSDSNSSDTTTIDYSIQPSLGSDDAPVKVVFFEDFTCPHCASFEANVFPKLKDEFLDSGDVEFFLINMQFLGPDSVMAGIAGECAYDQDEVLFWDYKTKLLEAQNQIVYDAPSLAALAEDIDGLSVPRLNICIRGSNHAETVANDLEIGRAIGVRATPTILVNGEKVNNNYNLIVETIRKALKEDGQKALRLESNLNPTL